MYPLLIVLIVLAAILMCFIVLIQNSKGGGLAAGFASSNQIMGVRKTTDFLEKTTWVLAIAMAVLSVIAAWSLPHATKATESVIMEQAAKQSPISAETITDLGATELPADAE